MTSAPQTDAAANPPVQAAYHSRWRRFSPSMGWKAFWSEIVIVVLGVAIALAANEAVEDWSWRGKVRDAEARLRADVESVFVWGAEQYAAQPCVDAQLTGLARRVMDSGATLTPAPLYSEPSLPGSPSYVARIPTRPWQFPVWEALVANGTATHFSQRWQDRYGGIGGSVAMARLLRIEANQLIGRLRALSYPIPLDPGARREFLVDIESLRRQSTSTLVLGRQQMLAASKDGIAPPEETVDAYLQDSGTVQFCKQQGLPVADWRDGLKGSP